MAYDVHKNFAYSLVVTAPTPPTSGGTIIVRSGEGLLFPTPPCNVTVWPAGQLPTAANAEVVRITAKAGDTLTVTRGQEGSTLRTIIAGDQIAATITAKTLTDVEAAVDAVTSAGWQANPYNAADYAAVGGGTFVVEAADLAGYNYAIQQKTLVVTIAIQTATITGTVTGLTIKLPAGLTAGRAAWLAPFWYYDGANWLMGFATIASGGTTISLTTRPFGGAFTVLTNQMYIYGMFHIPLP